MVIAKEMTFRHEIIELQSLRISVTRWLYHLFNVWPFSVMKFAKCKKIFAKVGLKFCPTLAKPSKIAQEVYNFCQSGGILPNLATLLIIILNSRKLSFYGHQIQSFWSLSID